MHNIDCIWCEFSSWLVSLIVHNTENLIWMTLFMMFSKQTKDLIIVQVMIKKAQY